MIIAGLFTNYCNGRARERWIGVTNWGAADRDGASPLNRGLGNDRPLQLALPGPAGRNPARSMACPCGHH